MERRLKISRVNSKTGDQILWLFSIYGNVKSIVISRKHDEGVIAFVGDKSFINVLNNKETIEKESGVSNYHMFILLNFKK